MRQKKIRFFGGLLATQENWLNRQAQRGLRLVSTGKLIYEWEECLPGQVKYRVEFVGHKSKENTQDYRRFLEGMGYRVWEKPINLQFSIGKVQYRPWAEKGGRLATNSTTLDRELFIVEKQNDSQPFVLHTTFEDRLNYCRTLQKPWWTVLFLCCLLAVGLQSWIAGIFGLATLVPIFLYQRQIALLKKESHIREQ